MHCKKRRRRGNNTIPFKLATLVTFATLNKKVEIDFRDQLVTRDESPLVYRAPESASEHSHFGTCHIGTSTIRDCTSAIYLKLPCSGSSHGKSVQAPFRL